MTEDDRDTRLNLAYRSMLYARTALYDAETDLRYAGEHELSCKVVNMATALSDEIYKMRTEYNRDRDRREERCPTM